LRFDLGADRDQRASGGAPGRTRHRSFVDEGHRTPARAAIRAHQHLILVTRRRACGALATYAHDPQRAGRSRRSRWTSRPGRARIAFRPGRSGRTRLTLLAGRAGDTWLSLWSLRPLPAIRQAEAERDDKRDSFHPRILIHDRSGERRKTGSGHLDGELRVKRELFEIRETQSRAQQATAAAQGHGGDARIKRGAREGG
jgi:hypothetical protein